MSNTDEKAREGLKMSNRLAHLLARLSDADAETVRFALAAKTEECACWQRAKENLEGVVLAANKRAESAEGKLLPLEPTLEMKLEGGRRLLQFQDGSTDTDFSPLQWAAVKNDAERVWRSMWLAAQAR